ncbi:MAG: hypothetical protein R3D90_16580 [Paracoccaceae bacterium]
MAGMEVLVQREAVVDGVRAAEIVVRGHVIRLEGVLLADLEPGDFLFL